MLNFRTVHNASRYVKVNGIQAWGGCLSTNGQGRGSGRNGVFITMSGGEGRSSDVTKGYASHSKYEQ